MTPEATPPLILASGSPRRGDLLEELGIPFQVIVSDATEALDPSLDAESQSIVLAERKARATAVRLETGIVLGADTIVALDGEMLGKPRDDADAVRMLRLLSDREHRVCTGLAFVDAATGAGSTSNVASIIHFRSLNESEIVRYVATGEPRDKAGAYAVQGLGSGLISRLDGCFTNVVGLPLCETARLLTGSGFAIPPTWPGCRLPDGAPCPRN